MATFRDFPGVYQTLNAIRIHQILGIQRAGWDLELLVVDNDPSGPHSDRLRRFVSSISAASKQARQPGYDQFPQPLKVRYEPLESPTGTAPPRNKVFEIATGDAILCVDDHIDFMPYALERFCRWVDAHPDSKDLLQGPMMLDGLTNFHTHFDPPFRDGMQGTWGTDYPKASYNPSEWQDIDIPSKEPFDIHAQGLGVFGCLRGQWLGFNPHFREFGGEEVYIHTKYRNDGRRALCLPFLRWPHRFDNPNKRPYPLSSVAKVRNYVLGHLENGLGLKPVYDHFVKRINETGGTSVDTGVSQDIWDAIVANPERYPVLPLPSRRSVIKSEGCCPTQSLGGQPQQPVQEKPKRMDATQPPAASNEQPLEKRYARIIADTPSITRQMSRVRDMVAGVDSVIEFAPVCSGISTAIAINPGKMIYHWYKQPSGMSSIIRSKTRATYVPLPVTGESNKLTIPDHVSADLGVIHGWVGGAGIANEINLLASRCNRLLILFNKPDETHNPELIVIEKNANGQIVKHAPGLLPVVRMLIRNHPEWSVVETRVSSENYLYLSRLTTDRKEVKPGVLTQALTFAKAKLDVLRKDGGKYLSEEQAQPRIDLCLLCESRADNKCIECGCPLFRTVPNEGAEPLPGKVYHASQTCPVGKWLPVDVNAPVATPATPATPDVPKATPAAEPV